MVLKKEKEAPKLKLKSQKKKAGLTDSQKALYGLGAVTSLFVAFVFVIPAAQETYKAWTDPVLTLTNSNFEKYVKNTKEIMVEFYAPWCGHCKALAPEYEAAAIELKGKDPAVRLAKVDCIAHAAVCQKFNVTGYPTLKHFEAGEEGRSFNGERTQKGLVSFMMKEPRSEDLPEEQANLVKVVGKNFDSVISKAEGDSFVKFYAPWCGHCKAMAPAWEELADKYAEDSSLTIADFDATANDIPPGAKGFDYTGFPTIFWVPKGGEPIKYEGGRTLEDWEAYIQEQRGGAGSKDEL